MSVRNKKREKSLKKKQHARQMRKAVVKEYNYNYLLTLVYDGYQFGGYAKQKHKNTIQNILEDVLQTILKEHVKTIESSRTDAKVHALDQKVMFKYYTSLNLDKFVESVNNMLPKAIRVKAVELVDDNFHCRYDVVEKTYDYFITTKFNPFKRHYEYYHFKKLDFNKMNNACKHFVGTHDFSAFCSSKATQENKIRTIYNLSMKTNKDSVVISVTGSGFLYNMVRIIVGTLLEIGEGRIDENDIPNIIMSRDRKKAGQTAPAHGLFLKEIKY